MSKVKEQTNIQKFYAEKNIFLTGGTGFLGKLLLEKLLRSCGNLNKIYLLLRVKKGKTPKERLDDIFKNAIFQRIVAQNKDVLNKVVIVDGDCEKINLGMSDNQIETLQNEIDIVIHCAATVRFDETLKKATHINVRCVMDLLDIAKKMKRLKAFVHVSTAYSFSPRTQIDEVFYEPLLSGEKLLALVDAMPEKQLIKLTPHIIDEWPNSYGFTKSVSEQVIKTRGQGLPLAVVRPSIIISTALEPIPGWIDNIYGPTGVLHGVGLGLLHTMHCYLETVADLVPADLVINNILAVGWEVGTQRSNTEKDLITRSENIPIYNYTARNENPLRWYQFMNNLYELETTFVSTYQLWYCFMVVTRSPFIYNIYFFFLHTVPAHVADTIAVLLGKKPLLVNGYKKISKFLQVIGYYCTRDWEFSNNNTQNLWRIMDKNDRKLFPFSMKLFNWKSFFFTYAYGARQFLVNEPIETIFDARMRNVRFTIAHYSIVSIVLILLFKFISFIVSIFM